MNECCKDRLPLSIRFENTRKKIKPKKKKSCQRIISWHTKKKIKNKRKQTIITIEHAKATSSSKSQSLGISQLQLNKKHKHFLLFFLKYPDRFFFKIKRVILIVIFYSIQRSEAKKSHKSTPLLQTWINPNLGLTFTNPNAKAHYVPKQTPNLK